MLFASRPSLGEEELKLLRDVFDSRWLGMGSYVEEFEKEISNYIGGRHVIAVNTGTSALHLALASIGTGVGDEVIVPSLTFCAGVQVITALGAKPVFCEVLPADLNIDIKDVRSKITPRTKAIMPVHFSGIACNMDELLAIREETGIRIIEDAAHAFGSSYKGKMIGSFGDICCFSFDPIKNITCGEGGAIVVNDSKHAELLMRKRVLGIDKDGWSRHNQSQGKDYDVSVQGYRYHMSNINAAIGLVQLKKAGAFLEKKREIVQRYNDRLSKIDHLEILKWNLPETFPFSYTIRVREGLRNKLLDYLPDKGIRPGLNYIPNHLHSFFRSEIKLPVTDMLYEEIMTLPLYYDLAFDEVEHVIRSIEDFFYNLNT